MYIYIIYFFICLIWPNHDKLDLYFTINGNPIPTALYYFAHYHCDVDNHSFQKSDLLSLISMREIINGANIAVPMTACCSLMKDMLIFFSTTSIGPPPMDHGNFIF